MKRTAFLSMESLEGYYSYDELLVEPLRERGWDVELVPWRSTRVDWTRYDAVVIRTPWDYYEDPDEFLNVLHRIDGETRLENPLEVVVWNLDKRYLLDLGARGVPVVPTILLDGPSSGDWIDRCRALEATELVFKPVVSANAANTHRVPVERLGPLLPFDASRSEAWLVQPFLPTILDDGEVSLFYFGGTYSHAIRKRPAPGDFRVQEEHGGVLDSIEPSVELRETADLVLRAVGRELLYARVDLARHEDRWVLMELELIEPSLYFNMDPASPERFARAFEAWFDGGPAVAAQGDSR